MSKDLDSLTIEEVIIFMNSLNLPNCEESVRRNKIDGNTLAVIESASEFADLELVLSVPKARVFYNALQNAKLKGVSASVFGDVDDCVPVEVRKSLSPPQFKQQNVVQSRQQTVPQPPRQQNVPQPTKQPNISQPAKQQNIPQSTIQPNGPQIKQPNIPQVKPIIKTSDSNIPSQSRQPVERSPSTTRRRAGTPPRLAEVLAEENSSNNTSTNSTMSPVPTVALKKVQFLG
eukprot:CAMPEP_0182434316 /NCGR_PEP_ID=MMETSP1167-20130531/69077_1 /TAXON_ID=2988 /ORGANISM="Mallomonas Sp, Strain CCMP3275" /LENGTH=230 /DNA_ID=CAMNT_0024624043 /DNA_START=80 /DNA_END=768 /DNA_ORIENTATION=-